MIIKKIILSYHELAAGGLSVCALDVCHINASRKEADADSSFSFTDANFLAFSYIKVFNVGITNRVKGFVAGECDFFIIRKIKTLPKICICSSPVNIRLFDFWQYNFTAEAVSSALSSAALRRQHLQETG